MAVNYKSGTPSPRRSTEKFAAPFHPEKAACTGQNQAEQGRPPSAFFRRTVPPVSEKKTRGILRHGDVPVRADTVSVMPIQNKTGNSRRKFPALTVSV